MHQVCCFSAAAGTMRYFVSGEAYVIITTFPVDIFGIRFKIVIVQWFLKHRSVPTIAYISKCSMYRNTNEG